MENISTSVWFARLTQEERKSLISLLFGFREDVKKFPAYPLFAKLIDTLDAEYHALKKADESCQKT